MKKLKKQDIATILIFITGFILAVADIKMFHVFTDVLSKLSTWKFWLLYVIMFIFVLYTVKLFIKIGEQYRLLVNNKILSFKSLKILLLGYYLGFLVSFSNAFIVVMFNKYFIK